MLKSGTAHYNINMNSSLALNSYKLDTRTLQSSLKELDSMKEELQSTVSQYRLNEGHFLQENERLQQEIKR